MKPFLILLIITISINTSFGQTQKKERNFSPEELKTDLTFLKHLIFEVHVNPFWEISAKKYHSLLANISTNLKDSLNATDFLKLIKPVIAHLSDEHSQIYLKQNLLSSKFKDDSIYPPFTLKKIGKHFFIENFLNESRQLKRDLEVVAINGIPISKLITLCALDTIGFPDQRIAMTLKYFGYLYPWTTKIETNNFRITTGSGKIKVVKGVSLILWQAFIKSQNTGYGSNCEERISYNKYEKVGYIRACSFDVKPTGQYSLDSIKVKITNIFRQIQKDSIHNLIIDVSQNSGGNSDVGNYLISSFYSQPYRGYHVDFKKSDEYLKLFESWGFSKPEWASAINGKVLHFAADTIFPENLKYRFKGKVTVVMGPSTFSSAMTFVTLIKDNHIAPIIGQPSLNGHPTGLGEQFYTTLPNTRIFVRLSVKEFIRPADKIKENILIPDKLLIDSQLSNPLELLKIVN